METKKMNLDQMESMYGGDFLDGACAVLGASGAGLAVRAAIGATVAIPGWGQVALAAGAVACAGRGMDLW